MHPPYPEDFRSQVIAAVRAVGLVQPVAKAFGIAPTTASNWVKAARVHLPSIAERESAGRETALETRWGDWRTRRARARKMRARGVPLKVIQERLGYKSIASAHYAVKGEE